MYGYIYDVFLADDRYDKELIKIENRITDFGLQGHTIKLSLINNAEHAIQDMLKKGIKTIVAVGSDQLFSKIVDHVDQLQQVTLGLIPLGPNQQLAQLFGIPQGMEACQVLSSRLVKEVPLAQINNGYFIHSVIIQDPQVQVQCNKQFILQPTSSDATISISNLYETNNEKLKNGSALSVTITPKSEKALLRRTQQLSSTVVHSKQVSLLEPANIPIVVDGQKILKTPAKLKVSKKKISVIMGKERKI